MGIVEAPDIVSGDNCTLHVSIFPGSWVLWSTHNRVQPRRCECAGKTQSSNEQRRSRSSGNSAQSGSRSMSEGCQIPLDIAGEDDAGAESGVVVDTAVVDRCKRE